MSALANKRHGRAELHKVNGTQTAGVYIAGRPVMDPMNHLDAAQESLAETSTTNPYFGENDPGRLPHQEAMHVAKTRRWIAASSFVFVGNVLLGISLIPHGEAMAAVVLAVGILLYGLVWIFRMFLDRDQRRTILLASIVGLQLLLALGGSLLLLSA